MVIDVHMHIGKIPGFGLGADEILDLADRVGIDKVICAHLGALFYDMYEGNQETGVAMRKHPDRFLGYITISSCRYGRKAVEEIQRCYETYGMQGIKVSHNVGGVGNYAIITSVDDPFMDPIFEKAEELSLPVLAHATPDECKALSQRFPQVRLIMAHAGGCPGALGDWHKAVDTASHHSNIYLDTASSQVDMGYIEAAVEAIGRNRVVFGTDMPVLDPFVQLAKVSGADLDEEDRKAILEANAADLFRL
jgi:predicted TIM-barrel fold metal-dependent hydrolase